MEETEDVVVGERGGCADGGTGGGSLFQMERIFGNGIVKLWRWACMDVELVVYVGGEV